MSKENWQLIRNMVRIITRGREREWDGERGEINECDRLGKHLQSSSIENYSSPWRKYHIDGSMAVIREGTKERFSRYVAWWVRQSFGSSALTGVSSQKKVRSSWSFQGILRWTLLMLNFNTPNIIQIIWCSHGILFDLFWGIFCVFNLIFHFYIKNNSFLTKKKWFVRLLSFLITMISTWMLCVELNCTYWLQLQEIKSFLL